MDEAELRSLRDPKIDRIQLARQVVIVYLFKIFRMLMGILLLAFLLGSFWFIFVQAIWDNRAILKEAYNEEDTFVDLYELDNSVPASNMLKMTYFAFTTLSSVGFGDFHPKNTPERLVMVIIFLFTLTVFSAILGSMQDLLASQTSLDAEPGDPDMLELFFGVLEKFNNYLPLRSDFMEEIEDYFTFYW